MTIGRGAHTGSSGGPWGAAAGVVVGTTIAVGVYIFESRRNDNVAAAALETTADAMGCQK